MSCNAERFIAEKNCEDNHPGGCNHRKCGVSTKTLSLALKAPLSSLRKTPASSYQNVILIHAHPNKGAGFPVNSKELQLC